MRNSLLTLNPCKFPGCPNMPKFGCGGFCEDHKNQDPGKARKKSREERGVKMLTGSITNKRVPKILLKHYYNMGARLLLENPVCAECGAPILFCDFHAATAHILPKKKRFGFPSIAAHPVNRMFLGAVCGCHSRYDLSWSNASRMKVWPIIVVPAVILLYPLIHPAELKNLPPILTNLCNIKIDSS